MDDGGQPRPRRGASRFVVKNAFDLARLLGISRLLVQAEKLSHIDLINQFRESESILWVTRNESLLSERVRPRDVVVQIPNAALTRMTQLNLALLLAVLNHQAGLDEPIVCLSGAAGSGHLDMLHVTSPGRHLPRFRKHDAPFVATRDLARALEIALRFAVEGREGAPIGTIFVLGDVEKLFPYLRQLVLNPCKGHPKKLRNIHNPELLETLREFSAMDGAFVVTKGGTVESAGTYLDAPVRRAKLRGGLGARHAAALAITAGTGATAVALSSSSGDVTVFQEGRAILELERPLAPTELPKVQKARPAKK